jgi:PAS domain S-box-containing protein
MLSSTANVEGLLDAEPDALVGADSAGMIQSVNHQTELLFGYDPDDLFGLSVEVLVPQSARRIHQVHREGFNTHPKNQTMRSGLKVRERRHHCTQFPIEVSSSHLHKQDGRPVIAAVRVMTEPKKPGQGRAQMNRLPAVIEFIGEATISTTLHGVIANWNPTAQRLFGYQSQEIIGRSAALSPHARTRKRAAIIETDLSQYLTDPKRADKSYQLMSTEGTAVDYPLNMRHRDETLTEVLCNASAHRDTTGKILGVFAAADDVTNQMQARAEIAEQQAKEQMRLDELERFQQISIEGVLNVIELKKEIESPKGSGTTERGESNDQR